MSVEKPQTRIFVCVRCGATWELPPDARVPRGWDGQVLCDECSDENPTPQVVL